MISCLDDLIGILNVSEYSTSESGLYINDLDGITTQKLNLIKDDVEDYEDVANAWEKIYERAKRAFEKDILKRMRKYLTAKSIVHNVITSQFYENTTAPASGKRGYYLEFPISTNNLEVHFNYAQVYLTAEDTFSVFLYNATDGKMLESTSFTGNGSGLKKLSLGWSYAVHEYPRLFCCVDHTGKSFKQIDQYNYGKWPYADERVATGTPSYDLLTTGEISLILSYQIQCSISNFVCQRRHLFEYPFLYCLGIEFMKELLGSDEINQYTLVDREDNLALLDRYRLEYDEALNNVLYGLEPTDDGLCFTCNKMVTKKYAMP